MAKTAVDDYSATAASNTDIDGLDATGATGLVKSGDNYTRSMMAHLKGKMNDLGAVNTVAGTADAITVTLSSAPTALVDGMRFTFSATAANTGATTLNVTPAGGAALGAKKLMKWAAGVESALAAGDIAGAGSLVEVIYDSAADAAAGAFILAHPATAITFATNAQAVTGTSTVLAVNPAGLAFATSGYATTATAAGTTTLTASSEPQQYFTGTTTQTVVLPVTSTLNLGRPFRIVNNSTGAVTVQSSGANTILILAPGAAAIFTCILTSGTTAASWEARPIGITLGTAVASTSGTSIDFTGIPAWVKRVTVNFVGVSTSGTDNPIIQIGDSGGIENTGYTSSSYNITNTPSIGATDHTTGFGIRSGAGTNVLQGSVVINLVSPSANTWAATGTLVTSTVTMIFVAGSKSLSAVLDRVRITTTGGTDTFDLGTVNISYE